MSGAINGASVQIKFGELQELIKRAEAAEEEVGKLREQLDAGRIGAVPQLQEAVHAMQLARWVIGFGIGNLHYDDVVGWPWQKLLAFIEIFEQMPGLSVDDRDWAEDTKSFCKGAALREEERTIRKPGDKPTPLTL